MNWPICIIDNGSLLSGGSDDGSIYCFQGWLPFHFNSVK
jgi:hypothetical protein